MTVVRRRDDLLQGPSWGARCVYCRKWITKYDHTREDALAGAVSDDHDCLHLNDSGSRPE